MPTTITAKSKLPAVQIEEFACLIADLLVVENDNERVIGQAWIAGQDLLVTCGHIVEEYAANLGVLIAKFPVSKKRYSVLNIRMHPQYHKDAPMFGSDLAVLTVELSYPERELAPLPVLYEKKISAREQINSMRFNIVDGRSQRSEAVPIVGQFCNFAEKQNSQYIVHNLALSAENVGCPIFDGNSVVAIHCGNLPLKPGQTAHEPAKIALSVNALRQLNLSHYRDAQSATKLFNGIQVAAGFGAALLAIGLLLLSQAGQKPRNNSEDDSVTPITVTLNKPLASYVQGDKVSVLIRPHSKCYFTVIISDAQTREESAETVIKNSGTKVIPLTLFYPRDPDLDHEQILPAEGLKIGTDLKLEARAGSQSKMHIFAWKDPLQLVKTSELDAPDKNKPNAIIGIPLEGVRRLLREQMQLKHERPGAGTEIIVDLPDPQPAAAR